MGKTDIKSNNGVIDPSTIKESSLKRLESEDVIDIYINAGATLYDFFRDYTFYTFYIIKDDGRVVAKPNTNSKSHIYTNYCREYAERGGVDKEPIYDTGIRKNLNWGKG